MLDQNARQASQEPDEESALLNEPRKKTLKPRWQRIRSCCSCTTMLNVVLAIVVVALIMLLAKATREASGGTGSDGRHGTPAKGGDGAGSNATNPSRPHCAYTAYSDVSHLNFDSPTNFSFIELMDHTNYFVNPIFGEVIVLSAPYDQVAPLRVHVAYATTEPWVPTAIHFEVTENSLELRLKEDSRGYTSKPCLDLNVHIYVRADLVTVQNWEIVTANLDVVGTAWASPPAVETAEHKVSESISVTTVRGDVHVEYWSSRRTIIETTSGTIRGTYGLRDLLSFRSRSGKQSECSHTSLRAFS